MKLKLIILKSKYAICRFDSDSDIPMWIKDSEFFSVTRTEDELSVVSRQSDSNPEITEINKDWRILKIQGPLDFSLVGIIAEISRILKEINITIFTISTFETDYILVKNKDLDKAIDSLTANGHEILINKP